MSGSKAYFYGCGRVELCSPAHGMAGASSIALRGSDEAVKLLVLSVAPLAVALGGFIRFIIDCVIMTPKALGGVRFISLPLEGGRYEPTLRQWGFSSAEWVQNVNLPRVDMTVASVNPQPEGAA